MSDAMKTKTKIAALLAKANNTACTEAEAQAFNAKAHDLMLKYNIDRATIEKGDPIERGHTTLEVQIRPWSSAVLGGITKLYYCNYFSETKGRNHRVTIIGERQNLAMCHTIAVMVLRSIQQAARLDGGGRSFMTGAGYEVYRRCMEMYNAAHSTLPGRETAGAITSDQSRALVTLATSETEENDGYIEQTLKIKDLRTRGSSGPKVSDARSYNAGKAHGSTVQLRRNLLGAA